MPLFHVAGVNPGLLTMLHGARGAILREFDMPVLLDTLVREQVAYAFLAPVLINMLLSTPGVEGGGLLALEKFFYGASPISEDVLLRAKARLNCSFTQLYGLTETVGGGRI
jgi:fatty-acyl-CoA synthase